MLFFLPKRKSYYHCHSIPLIARPYLNGRLEFWQSLRTADKATASVRSAAWNARLVKLFAMLKKDGGRMTKDHVYALVSKYMESALDEGEDFRAICGPVTNSYREGVWSVSSHQFDEASEALVSCDFSKVEREAIELLKGAGLPQLDVTGAEFGRLCRRLLTAKIEVLREEAGRWDGEYKEHRSVSTRAATPGVSQVAKGGDTVPTPLLLPCSPKFSGSMRKSIPDHKGLRFRFKQNSSGSSLSLAGIVLSRHHEGRLPTLQGRSDDDTQPRINDDDSASHDVELRVPLG
jgi:hypothetical protein